MRAGFLPTISQWHTRKPRIVFSEAAGRVSEAVPKGSRARVRTPVCNLLVGSLLVKAAGNMPALTEGWKTEQSSAEHQYLYIGVKVEK